MRGRCPAGLEYAEKIEGSELAKERAQVVAELMTGGLRLQDACRRLDVHETRVHQLRHRGWQWLVRAMEPGTTGRPRTLSVTDSDRIRELEQALAEKELELQQALVREEVALILPQRVEVEAGKGAAAECQVAQAEAALTAPATGAELLPTSADSDVLSVDEHMNIVQAFVEQQRAGTRPRQRGALQRQVRQRVLDLAERLMDRGHSLDESAQRLSISARTLRHWGQMHRQGDTVALLGRPRADSGSEPQQAVLGHLKTVGAGESVPALRQQFPSMARAELDELVKCYRVLWRAQNRRMLRVLHWQRPGTAWAMDFAEAPRSPSPLAGGGRGEGEIDGIYRYLLAVRDLASGKQLLGRPVMATTAEIVRAELTPLFLAYGSPWVLKSDNGPAFRADETKRLLARWGVFGLFSPPHTPSYNGAIEAAIGSLKTRTQRLADQAGHPLLWTSAVIEAARQEANATHPRRLKGATPDEVWDARAPLTPEGREQFRAAVQRYQAEEWAKQASLPTEPSHWEKAAVDRIAIRRALVAHDLLLFTRRSIPARIERPQTASKG